VDSQSKLLVARLKEQTGLSETQIWAVLNALAAAANEGLSATGSFELPGVAGSLVSKPKTKTQTDPVGTIVMTVGKPNRTWRKPPPAIVGGASQSEGGGLILPDILKPLKNRTGRPPVVAGVYDPKARGVARRRGIPKLPGPERI
jgi:hypothetical protein